MTPSQTSTSTPQSGVYQFELDGGRVCLDFANTYDSQGEHLSSYADLVAFAAQSDLLTPEDAAWLRSAAKRERATADRVMTRARRLREVLRSIFSAVADGQQPKASDIDYLNVDMAATMTHTRILPSADGRAYRWGWSGRNLDAPLWPITRSAADLLTSEQDLRLVRECGAADCKWLFLDTSKNRSRQWCSMQSCGNREKARRHYQRVRATRRAVTHT
jgi:predicted RNA-binding Zn ribbon-like protein